MLSHLISVNDVKDVVGIIGLPASAIIGVICLFNWGIIPSNVSEAHDDILTTKVKVEHNEQLMLRVLEQHSEQLANLNRALKQICVNTAKNDNRVYDCLKIDDQLGH